MSTTSASSATGSQSLTVNSVQERIKDGEIVYYLIFRFSIGLKNRKVVHSKIEGKGWKKLPVLENSFVWFGEKPVDVTGILQKVSTSDCVCRFMMGRLTDIGLLEGTGTPPVVSEGQCNTAPTYTLRDYGFYREREEFDEADGVSVH